MANRTAVRQSLALVVILPLALLMFEALAERGMSAPGWGWAEWKVFLVGALWSLTFWASLMVWGSWWTWKGGLKGAVAWGLAGAFVAWNTFAYFISYKYLRDMYHLPNVHILQFTIMEWGNAWALAKEVLSWWHLVLALAGVGILAWQLGNRFLTLGPWLGVMPALHRRLMLVVLSGAFLGLSALTLGWHRYQNPLPWDANWHRMFFQYALMVGGNTTNLRVAHRPPLPARPAPAKRPNVLLILNESLRADAILPEVELWEGFSETLAPRIYGRVSASPDYAVFTRAYANAGATNASVPSMLTGLPPEASTYDFHRHPTVWNYAKSMGYHTLLFTPQDWRWEHFDEFFLDRGVDVAVHRRHFKEPLVNDLGVDDGLVVDAFLEYLASAPKDRPFFGVVQFNVTHPPFYGGPSTEALPIVTRERYRPAVDLLDRYQDRLLAGLDRMGLTDDTLVIYTSDHGENIRSRNLGRLSSFYDESLRVPFWIKPPRDAHWAPRHQEDVANLRSWTGQVVQNLDIMPTLLDFWDLPVSGPWGPYAGQSLFAGGAGEERVVGAQNTGEIRAWSPEGCFALKPPYKLVLLSHMPPQLFDLARDPMEQQNLWAQPEARAANLPWIRDYMQSMPGRTALCRRLGDSCPRELVAN
jgi:phosphoglycerol transferase MdoB-like AlkP superfamily enzyme